MLYAYFFGVYQDEKSMVDFNNKNISINPGKSDFLKYIKNNGKAIKRLSDWKRGATVGNEEIYIKWINVMKEICDHVDGKKPD